MSSLKSNMKSLAMSSALRRIFLNTSTAVAIALASATTFSIQAEAQSTTSVLRVRVINSAGQDMPGISVTILHVPTGRTFDRTTNSAGILVAKGLPIGGPYVVRLTDQSRVMKDAPASIDNIQLNLGEAGSVTLLANRGIGSNATFEEIVVTSKRVLTALRTGAGRDFNQDTIEGISSISRDFTSVLETDSKILVDDSVPRGPAVSIAGANFRFNSVTIDGVAQNDNFGLSLNASATQRAPISMDAIQAINVNVAPFDVTFGNFLGGNINIVTKSGTNEFHGSAYGFYTDESLTGNTSQGEDLAIGNFNEKVYGGALGGPIIEDKLFFFVNYEKFETTHPANSQTINNIPGVTQGDIDRAIQIFNDVYGFDPGKFATSDTDKDEKILVKLDWNINDSHRASFTYQRADGDTIFDDFPELGILNSGRYNVNERLNSFGFQLFSDWTDNFSTEVKIGYKDVKNRQVSIDSTTPDFLINLSTGGTIAAGGDRFRQRNTLDNTSRIFRLKGDYTLGDHTLTGGFEQERNSVVNFFLPFSRGQIVFSGLDNLENRQPDFLLFGGSNSGVADDAKADFSLTTNSVYLQDEWLVTDDLTVKFGVRYDWMTNNDKVPFNQNFLDRNGFDNTENLDGKDLFLPRFGFNWQADDRLTIRGGVGLFGGGTPLIMLGNSYAGNGITRTFAGFFAPFFGEPFTTLFNDSVANLPNADAISSNFQQFLSVGTNTEVDALSPDMELLSSWKYNLALDYVLDLSSMGLGDDWNITLEAIYTDVKNGYDIYEGRRVQTGTAPDGRPIYNNTDIASGGFNAADYIVRNTSEGSSTIISFDIAKSFDTDFGYFTTTLGYTHQDVNDPRSYNRFVGFETLAFDPQRDLNNPDNSTSRFEVPNRITATINWEKEFWGDNKTKLGFVFTGRSGRNFSYIFNGTGAFGGNFLADFASPDNPGPSLFYVPSGLNDPLVTGDAAFLSSLDATINGDGCLSKYRGGIIPRNACKTGWVNQVNMHFSQEIEIAAGHKIELMLDIENLGNLINSNWGRLDTIFQPSNVPLANVAISADGTQFVLSPSGSATASAANPNIARIPSAYRIQFGIRYRF